jgi:nicotinamide-nucleotide amidase
MQATILSVGDELISGATVDTNSAWLSQELADRGVRVVRHVTVSDDLAAIAFAIGQGVADCQLVIITGGLGPTEDDLTRQALAKVMGVKLAEDEHSFQRISAFFTAMNRPMTPSNRVQALVPEGGWAIDNECGTAPGLAASVGAAKVYVLPGPPHEMKDMFTRRVAPLLPPLGQIARRTLHTCGAGESQIGEKLADLMQRGRNPSVGTTAGSGLVSVRILAHGETRESAAAMAAAVAAEAAGRLGDLVFACGDQGMAEVVGEALRQAKATLALAESCTGGLVGELITAVPGSSDYFRGGIVCYANQVKTDLLGVSEALLAAHGAVSAEVAAVMAAAAAQRLGADWGLSLTGIAGPGGGSEAKPVGMVFVGLSGPGVQAVHRHVFPGGREMVRRRAALWAMNHLRLALLGRGG